MGGREERARWRAVRATGDAAANSYHTANSEIFAGMREEESKNGRRTARADGADNGRQHLPDVEPDLRRGRGRSEEEGGSVQPAAIHHT